MAISIVSPTGRALQAELEQSQGMPPDQLMAKLNQNVGMVPFAELLAMKMQYDRLKNAQPPQPPPQGTVAQDMAQEISSRQMGVAGLNPQNVGTASMAGGGIVAFAGGGFNASQWAEGIDVARANQIVEEAVRAGRLNPADYARYADPMASAAEKRSIWQRAVSGASRVGNTPVSEAAGKAGRFLTGNAGRASELVKGGAKGALGLGTILEGYTEGPRAVMGDAIPSERIYAHYGMDPYATPGDEPLLSPMGFPIGTKTENDKQLERDVGVRALTHLQGIFGFGPERESKEEAARLKAEEQKRIDEMDIGRFFERDPRTAGSGIAALTDPGVRGIGRPQFTKTEKPEELTLEGEMERNQQIDQQYGITKPFEDQQAALEKEKSDLTKEKKKDTWLSVADGFFRMAQAASQPGATFLGSAAEGAVEGTKQYRAVLKESRAAEKALTREQFALAQARANRTGANLQSARESVAKREERIDNYINRENDRFMELYKVDAQMAIAEADRKVRLGIAKLEQLERDSDPVKGFYRAYENIKQSDLSEAQKGVALQKLWSDMERHFSNSLGGVLAKTQAPTGINFGNAPANGENGPRVVGSRPAG